MSYQERAIATMLGTSANILGVTLGFLLPPMFIDEYVAESDYSKEQKVNYMKQTQYMLIVFAGFSVCALVSMIIFFREKPPAPPPQDPNESN